MVSSKVWINECHPALGVDVRTSFRGEDDQVLFLPRTPLLCAESGVAATPFLEDAEILLVKPLF